MSIGPRFEPWWADTNKHSAVSGRPRSGLRRFVQGEKEFALCVSGFCANASQTTRDGSREPFYKIY
jgi:hypothetical protein